VNIEKIEERINSDRFANQWTLIKLFISSFFLCHVVGTLYYCLGVLEIDLLGYENSWIQVYDIKDAWWFRKFSESFYFGQGMILLIGTKG
jgi:hypothetical protein